MIVLIIDNYDLLGYEISKALVEVNKNIFIDFLTNATDNKRNIDININFLVGDRRNIVTFRNLKKYYDVVIDLSAVLKDDIEIVFDQIKFEKYILKSSFQVYNFIKQNILLHENVVNKDYYRDALEMYLSPKYNQNEIYAREKMKCEFELIKRAKSEKIHYVILRPSKIYSYEDKFNDLNWIMKRLNNKCPIIFRNSDIVKHTLFNPIYIKDLAKVVSIILNTDDVNNNIFNVAQDEFMSLLDLVECLAYINNIKYEYYILEDEHFNSIELANYRIPISDGKIISNEKLKTSLNFRPQNYSIWLAEICKQLNIKERNNNDNYLNERLYLKKYNLIRQKINNIKIV